MANIQNELNNIKTALYGKDVRNSIHDAIKTCYDDASVNNDNANMEVKLARGTHNTLNDRLCEVDEKQNSLSSQLEHNKNYLENKVNLLDNVKASKQELDIERERINLLTKIENNETEGNSELLDIRIDIDGNYNKTAGEAIRNQVKDIKTTLRRSYNYPFIATASLFDEGYNRVIINQGSILELFLEDIDIKNNELYVYELYPNHLSNKNRGFLIKSNKTPTYSIGFSSKNYLEDIDSITIPDFIEKCELVDSNNELKGYAIIDWSKTSNNGINGTYQRTGLSDTYIKYKPIMHPDNELLINKLGKLPFWEGATLRRPNFEDRVICDKNAISSLNFTALTNERYYIKELYRNHTGGKYRRIVISNESNSDEISFKENNYTDDINESFIPNFKENCKLTNSKGEVRGNIEIQWDKVNNADGLDLNYASTGLSLYSYSYNLDKLDKLDKVENIKWHLNSKYYAVVDNEMNIYFDSVLRTNDFNNLTFKVSSNTINYPQLKCIDECIRIKAINDNIGQHDITIKVYNKYTFEFLTEKIFKLVVSKPVNNIVKKIIFLGDSLTADGTIQSTIKELCGNKLILYGTREKNGLLSEGRAGWSANDYISNASKGGLINPFYNANKEGNVKFDFNYYINNNLSFADVDIVNIFLGRNDGYTGDFADKIKKIVDDIHSFNPNIIITLMCPYHTADTNYGCGQYLQNTWEFRKNTFIGLNKLLEVFSNKESENIYIIHQHTNLDTKYDYPFSNIAVSNRNPQEVFRVTDNVHPSKYGYMKFADVWYSWFVNIICN